jgi:hypothetical protein
MLNDEFGWIVKCGIPPLALKGTECDNSPMNLQIDLIGLRNQYLLINVLCFLVKRSIVNISMYQ